MDDVKALTKFGDSNKRGTLDELYVKEGPFELEKTGRKGRGFKSVFALPGDGIVVHVFSNGFNFKFVKRLGTIIPIWEDVDDAPETGTRIVVEGFEEGYIAKLMPEIRKMFGVDDISEFFARCPIIYLRKIKSVSVEEDDDLFSVEISVKEREYSDERVFTQETPVAGIIHQGQFQKAMWEFDHVTINVLGDEKAFSAVRYCYVYEHGHKQRLASVFAPIINDHSDMTFNKGALYSDCPLFTFTHFGNIYFCILLTN